MRIVIKIGSSSLTTPTGRLNQNCIDEISALIGQARQDGHQLAVVSSGAIAAGITPLGLDQRPRDLALAQATAAVGQGRLMAEWSDALAMNAVVGAQVLLSAQELFKRQNYNNAQRSLEMLATMGAVAIINENDAVATDEIRFGDNDRLAAIVSHLIKADKMILCTDVDGLYTAPPSQPGARLIRQVRSAADLDGIDLEGAGSKLGTGGMVTKVASAQIAAANGTQAQLIATAQLEQALAGEDVGTTFLVTGKRRSRRYLWLAYAATSRGRLILDKGAVKAITEGKKSLLAAGITQVEGVFGPGAVVELANRRGAVIAKGRSAYSSEQILELIQAHQQSSEAKLAGQETRPAPVVHRDHLAETRY